MRAQTIATLRTSLRVLESADNKHAQALFFGTNADLDGTVRYGRLHETTGPAASVFISLILAKTRGPVLCCAPNWSRAVFYPPGLAQLGLDPGRIVLVRLDRAHDVLQAAHEGLRAGWQVVLELDKPLGLTPARRLQLAAEAGGGLGIITGTDSHAGPLTLSATTRWIVSNVTGALWPAALRLHLRLVRNRGGPLGQWYVEWDHASRSLSVVSAACNREDRAAQSAIA